MLELLGAWSLFCWRFSINERQENFRLARGASDSSGKPLLVVGKPQEWDFSIVGHPCGDVTLDIDPRVLEQCRTSGIVGDVTTIPFPDKYFGAVYVSHVLEHLDSQVAFNQAMDEIHRVADAVFVCWPRWWSPGAWSHPDHKLLLGEKNGTVTFISQIRTSTT